MILLNLSFTVKIFFFSFTISTEAFSRGMNDTFFSNLYIIYPLTVVYNKLDSHGVILVDTTQIRF